MMRAGGALERLLPCPLLPALVVALVDEPPPAPPLPALPLPLLIGCLPCGASAIPQARQDALNTCAMDRPSNRVQWSSARVRVEQSRTFL
jgi:hypothetical protein